MTTLGKNAIPSTEKLELDKMKQSDTLIEVKCLPPLGGW